MDNKIIKKHSKKFSLFLLIGVLKVILTITPIYLLIDILKIKALLASTIVVIIVFFITYLTYVTTKVIKPRFIKYTSATIGFSITTILLIWFFVDFIGFSGVFSSVVVVGIIFIIKYLFFNSIGLIQHD